MVGCLPAVTGAASVACASPPPGGCTRRQRRAEPLGAALVDLVPSPGCGNCPKSETMDAAWRCVSKIFDRAAPSGASIPTCRSPWPACSGSARRCWS